MRKGLLLGAVLALVLVPGSLLADGFDDIAAKLNRPGCMYFQFATIIESEIFEQVDSTYGDAYMASDGRYYVNLGEERYIYDLINVYTYSLSSGQVIIESPEQAAAVSREISFITRLDKDYDRFTIDPDSLYRLVKRLDVGGNFPDSMLVTIDLQGLQLKQVEYYDINEELNKIIFLNENYSPSCDDMRFEPEFPDSVERVRLY